MRFIIYFIYFKHLRQVATKSSSSDQILRLLTSDDQSSKNFSALSLPSASSSSSVLRKNCSVPETNLVVKTDPEYLSDSLDALSRYFQYVFMATIFLIIYSMQFCSKSSKLDTGKLLDKITSSSLETLDIDRVNSFSIISTDSFDFPCDD